MAEDNERNEFKHRAEELKGKAKENIGKATGDTPDEVEGKAKQSKAKLRRIGDKVRNTLRR
ncbi:CsbD family protein [Halostreptopolyspora alba]|uniref:CsbD family protein n=1 Tax=Halostreptopolyspora alba TaxID=2487137 RepID=A0A3N0EF23_9ACTN|nr:CsbD family protein [Nocardiopsaceae bacterium YIM 96095]